MTKLKIAFSIAAVFFVCLLSLTHVSAQTSTPKNQSEPSYEVVLQTLIGSNSANKSDVPQILSGAIKKLKTNYSYTNFRLASTYFQRVANRGAIDLKGISSEKMLGQERNYSVFSDLTFNDLQFLPDANGQKSFQFQNFRFGQRVPIITSTLADDSGKTNPIINYEQVGLTIQRLSLSENVPTVIGSVSTLKPDELMFLVLTVRSAE